ncbi:hypothetical protein CHLNCDRAFT_143750 [Chlorella variabilis]|uniref:TAFII28-like protein domain-containing protein n=1 Tax=Chlorella variabilis TaxID=554065 RepID=E1ZAD2_CHLVA|nr:hypothetical protein CHLNCDRAFT_143750 [Chlorella variabilis]EFN57242.1 hypothetical protein CHLNCDRAFT_143750 [Chlorella variabilis]|eukprot:XP_005849344.1 hypothetical protein CHLNCDRAFT_143750 [Chlorella variabilis]
MADDMDMPDLEAGFAPETLGQQQAVAAAAAAAPGPAGADEVLNEEDELELALEAELEDADEEQQQQQQQQQPGGEPRQQQAGDAQLPAGAALQDAARAATTATTALQREDEELPLTDEGFIDLDRLTAKQHQRYNNLVNEILTEQQLDRYSAFRRSSLKKGIQLLMIKTLGGAPNAKALIALSSVTKSFVDDLVAAAIGVAAERGETTPLQPAHIHAAYQRLIEQEKVPGKTARRRAFL